MMNGDIALKTDEKKKKLLVEEDMCLPSTQYCMWICYPIFTGVSPAHSLYPGVAMDMLFLWQPHAFVDGLEPPLNLSLHISFKLAEKSHIALSSTLVSRTQLSFLCCSCCSTFVAAASPSCKVLDHHSYTSVFNWNLHSNLIQDLICATVLCHESALWAPYNVQRQKPELRFKDAWEVWRNGDGGSARESLCSREWKAGMRSALCTHRQQWGWSRVQCRDFKLCVGRQVGCLHLLNEPC